MQQLFAKLQLTCQSRTMVKQQGLNLAIQNRSKSMKATRTTAATHIYTATLATFGRLETLTTKNWSLWHYPKTPAKFSQKTSLVSLGSLSRKKVRIFTVKYGRCLLHKVVRSNCNIPSEFTVYGKAVHRVGDLSDTFNECSCNIQRLISTPEPWRPEILLKYQLACTICLVSVHSASIAPSHIITLITVSLTRRWPQTQHSAPRVASATLVHDITRLLDITLPRPASRSWTPAHRRSVYYVWARRVLLELSHLLAALLGGRSQLSGRRREFHRRARMVQD